MTTGDTRAWDDPAWDDPPGGDDPLHMDVGAYALGVLDEWDTALFEAHLSECPQCRADLDGLQPAATLLSEADGDAVRELERIHLTDRLLAAARAERGRWRRRQALALAAGVGAVVLVGGAALAAGANWFAERPPVAAPEGTPGPSTQPPQSPFPFGPGIGGPDLADGERFSAVDPDTGVRADLVVTATESGSQVAFALTSLTGPMECRLQIVDSDGVVESLATWQVPGHGYGTDDYPAPLLLQTSTAVSRDELREIRIQSMRPDGPVTLVTVAL